MAMADISYLGRWKSSAVLRYIEDALQDIPLNRFQRTQMDPGSSAPTTVMVPCTPNPPHLGKPSPSAPAREPGNSLAAATPKWEGDTVRGVQEADEFENQQSDKRGRKKFEEKTGEKQTLEIPASASTLWAISRNGRSRTRHVVTNASWGLALDEWSTACGWRFAKYHVKVELTKVYQPEIKGCTKCSGWEKLRDRVKGGVQMAQLMDL